MKDKIITISMLSIMVIMFILVFFINFKTSSIEEEDKNIEISEEFIVDIREYTNENIEIKTINDISSAFYLFIDKYLPEFEFISSNMNFKEETIEEIVIYENIEIKFESNIEDFSSVKITITKYQTKNSQNDEKFIEVIDIFENEHLLLEENMV